MKTFILLSAIFCFISFSCTSGGAVKVATPPVDSFAIKDEIVFKGVDYDSMFGKYDVYRSYYHMNPTVFGDGDTAALYGAYYISSRGGNELNVKIANTQETRIISAKRFFVEYMESLGSTRITNYKGTITVLDHERKIELKPNETILIDENGNFNKFYNKFASVDSTYLETSLVRFENVNLARIISRIAERYGLEASFKNYSFDVLSIGNYVGSFDCTDNLFEGLRLLQSIVPDRLTFSIQDHRIYVDQYSK